VNLNKLLSGKYFFTVVTALVFIYATHTKILTGEQVYGIIMLVVAAYFGRRTSENNNPNPNP